MKYFHSRKYIFPSDRLPYYRKLGKKGFPPSLQATTAPWNFPHGIGTTDGKHIANERPKLSGIQHFNYKGFFSLVLLAICDAKHYTYVDFRKYGRTFDSSVLRRFSLDTAFKENKFDLPAPTDAEGLKITALLSSQGWHFYLRWQ